MQNAHKCAVIWVIETFPFLPGAGEVEVAEMESLPSLGMSLSHPNPPRSQMTWRL